MPSIILTSSATPKSATFAGRTSVGASLRVPVRLSAAFEGSTDFQWKPGAHFKGKGSFNVALSTPRRLSATFSGRTASAASTVIQNTDPFSLSIVAVLVPEFVGPTDLWLPRLKVNGVEVSVVSGQFIESADDAGAEVELLVTDVDDASLFVDGAVYDFGLGEEVKHGSWNESTFEWLIRNGEKVGSVKQTSQNDRTLQDTFTVRIKSQSKGRLQRCPERPYVLYNSAVQSVNAEDFEVLTDTDGNEYVTEVEGVAGLRLYQMIKEIFVDRCGFSWYYTNIPDYVISRVDCPIGVPYLQSVRHLFGISDPVVMEIDNYIYILDTTMAMPAGFPAPVSVDADRYRTLTVSEEVTGLDGVILTYVESGYGYDYVTLDSKVKEVTSGTFGSDDYVSTLVEQKFREYRKFSMPGVVLKRELYYESRQVDTTLDGSAQTVVDSKRYDSRNRLTQRDYSVESRELDIDLSVALGTPSRSKVQVETIEERYTYEAHPFQANREYLAKKESRRDALILVDADNQQLGGNFEQEYRVGARSGNLKEGQTTRFGLITKGVDTWKPLRNGMVEVSEFEYNFVARQATKDGVPREEPGDVAIHALAPQQKEIIVLREAGMTRTSRPLGSVHGGEMPVQYLIPLVRRLVFAMGSESRQVQSELIGFDPVIKKGLPIRFYDRGVDKGVHLPMGRTIAFGPQGAFVQLQCKQLREVSDYSAGDSNPVGTFTQLLESNDSKVFNIKLQCKAGYELRSTSHPAITVEAKRLSDVSWTGIEGSGLDLTPYDGTVQDFQVRLTTGALSGKSTEVVTVEAVYVG